MSQSQDKNINYECSLYGKFDDTEYERVREMIIALCGEEFIELRHHELILTPSITTPLGPQRNLDIALRMRNAYQSTNSKTRNGKWQIYMLGLPDPRKEISVVVRPVLYSQIMGNFSKYFLALGYSNEYEVAKEGFTYFYDEDIVISIFKLYRVGKRFDVGTLYNYDGNENWIIEASSIPVKLERIPEVTEKLETLKDYLKDTVNLIQVDHLILENKITYRKID